MSQPPKTFQNLHEIFTTFLRIELRIVTVETRHVNSKGKWLMYTETRPLSGFLVTASMVVMLYKLYLNNSSNKLTATLGTASLVVLHQIQGPADRPPVTALPYPSCFLFGIHSKFLGVAPIHLETHTDRALADELSYGLQSWGCVLLEGAVIASSLLTELPKRFNGSLVLRHLQYVLSIAGHQPLFIFLFFLYVSF